MKWKRIVDNKMRWFGDIDDKKGIIRINKSKKKNKKKGDIINTIAHEEMHRVHPKMWEKTIDKKVIRALGNLSQKTKNKLYKLYK